MVETGVKVESGYLPHLVRLPGREGSCHCDTLDSVNTI